MSNDYLTALGAAMTIPERQYLRDLATQAAAEFGPACTVVNIGVALGCSCVCLRAGAPESNLVGIDIDPEAERGDWALIRADSRRFTLPPPIHLLFVDGAHDYAAVKSDIERWAPSVILGGFVAFHDYGNHDKIPWTAGVKRAVDECMNGDGWTVIGTTDSIKTFQKLGG